MATEFYDVNVQKRKNLLFIFDDHDFEVMEKVLFRYEKLTGLSIDPYGNSKIDVDHARLIGKLLQDYLSETKTKLTLNDRTRLQKIQGLLLNVNATLITIGD